MKYIITKTEPFRKYFGMGEYDPTLYCRDLYTLFDLSCVEISETLFDTLYPILPAGYEEVSQDEALFGSMFFAEVRDEVKIVNPDAMMADTMAMPEHVKVQFTLTDEVKETIRRFMWRFAKEIIETEYNYRFRKLHNTTELEKESWEIQRFEAIEWLTYKGAEGHITPFLDYLAEERQIDKTELANKILQKADEWQDKLAQMLVESQKLLRQFEKTKTIREINVLYEKYFGIMMPIIQAKELGLVDALGDRIYREGDQIYWDVRNPRLGNKLNF